MNFSRNNVKHFLSLFNVIKVKIGHNTISNVFEVKIDVYPHKPYNNFIPNYSTYKWKLNISMKIYRTIPLSHETSIWALLFHLTSTSQHSSSTAPAHLSTPPPHQQISALLLHRTSTSQRSSSTSPAHFSTPPPLHQHISAVLVHRTSTSIAPVRDQTLLLF